MAVSLLQRDRYRLDSLLRPFGDLRAVRIEIEQDVRTRWPCGVFHCTVCQESIAVEGEWTEPALHYFAEQFGPIYAALHRAGGRPEEFRPLVLGAGLRILADAYRRAAQRYDPTGRREFADHAFRGVAHRIGIDMAHNAPAEFSEAAETKAKETLYRYLTEAQAAEFAASGAFTVKIGESCGKHVGTYRITKARSFNCEKLETSEKFCVVPDTRVPICDQMLTTKLMLEGDATRFFKTANKTGGNNPLGTYGVIRGPNPYHAVGY